MHQVEQHLFHLVAVHRSPGQVRLKMYRQFYPACLNQVTAQSDYIINNFVERSIGTSALALPRKIQQPADNIARAPRLFQDQFQVFVRFCIFRQALHDKLRKARDGCQRIIQLMRNTCHHLAHRRQLRRLDQAILCRALSFHAIVQLHLHGAQLTDRDLQALILIRAGDYGGKNARQRFQGDVIVMCKSVP